MVSQNSGIDSYLEVTAIGGENRIIDIVPSSDGCLYSQMKLVAPYFVLCSPLFLIYSWPSGTDVNLKAPTPQANQALGRLTQLRRAPAQPRIVN